MPEVESLSRTQLSRLIATGGVIIDGLPVTDAKARLSEGAEVVITIDAPEESDISPETIPLTVVFEDADLIVIDKPAGMVVHPAPGSPAGTLVNALLAHCGDDLSGVGGVKRPGIVHRIDKDTSGLLVVAKSDAAPEGLARQFADHSLERAYLAVANGHPVPAEGTISTRLGRSDADRKKMAVLPKESSRG